MTDAQAVRWPGPAAAAARTLAGAAVLLAVACGGSSPPGSQGTAPPSGPVTAPATASAEPAPGPDAQVPAFRHIVVVVMENHSYDEIIGNPAAPYINGLARQGALFTRSFAVSHPSEPNYLALFSGSTHGITDDSCPHTLQAPNLAADLIAAGRSFTGYAEGLPRDGSPVCESGGYARKHAPWTNFADVPASASRPFSAFPARNLGALPTVAWVIPDLCNDMHDCGVATGDRWLRRHLSGYAQWARANHSLLIVTWDEDDSSAGNHIATVMFGQYVKPGRYGQQITHYTVLATVEAAYGLRRDAHAAGAAPITWAWSRP